MIQELVHLILQSILEKGDYKVIVRNNQAEIVYPFTKITLENGEIISYTYNNKKYKYDYKAYELKLIMKR